MEDETRQVTAYRANMNGSLGQFRNGQTQAEIEAAREAERAAAAARRRAEQEAARKAAELEAARQAEAARLQAVENQKLIDRLVGNSKQIKDIPLTNTGFAKYRIITPVKYRQVGSKLVPQIRFESVRELNPEAVSSLVHRGYEVQSVDPNTPLSSSKAYGPSVVKHSGAAVNVKDVAGVTTVTGRRAAMQRAEANRSSYRRVIR
ncbi:MAG: hypothetical protein MPK62_04955 [Alphaproteobacteria bacterium]|nr:hypothetical protein [Alphaproteobacteria bacterium]